MNNMACDDSRLNEILVYTVLSLVVITFGLDKYTQHISSLNQKRVQYNIPSLEKDGFGENYYYTDGNKRIYVERDGVSFKK